MSKWVDITGISIPSDENNYDELIVFADAIAELDPIDMEIIKAEAYARGIDSERKRIADAWCKAEYERGYKDGRESAERKGKWIYCEDDEGQDGYRCSECGFFVPWYYDYEDSDYILDYKACPHCLAKMKGAEDET